MSPVRKPKPRPPIDRTAQRRVATGALRQAVLERDDYQCRKCGVYAPDGRGLELHHRIEFARGGATTADNLDTLCAMCHREWTYLWAEPPLLYERWLGLGPAAVAMQALLILAGEIEDPRFPSEQLRTELGISREAAAKLLRRQPP